MGGPRLDDIRTVVHVSSNFPTRDISVPRAWADSRLARVASQHTTINITTTGYYQMDGERRGKRSRSRVGSQPGQQMTSTNSQLLDDITVIYQPLGDG